MPTEREVASKFLLMVVGGLTVAVGTVVWSIVVTLTDDLMTTKNHFDNDLRAIERGVEEIRVSITSHHAISEVRMSQLSELEDKVERMLQHSWYPLSSGQDLEKRLHKLELPNSDKVDDAEPHWYYPD